MSVIHLTGSGDARMDEIQNNWLVFEPTSDGRVYLGNDLYTVPAGQTFGAEFTLNTGSVSVVGDTIVVKKDIHIFHSETEAEKFVDNIGAENVSTVIERQGRWITGKVYTITEIHLINTPSFDVSCEMKNLETERGYKIEIFGSGSNGLYEIETAPVFNDNGELISNTFLKYFEIEADTE